MAQRAEISEWDIENAAFWAATGRRIATRNLWISIGYNVQGFEDDDYAASRYTASGPFIKLRVKADQDTFRDLGWRRPGR